jgi:hypothetical protein
MLNQCPAQELSATLERVAAAFETVAVPWALAAIHG